MSCINTKVARNGNEVKLYELDGGSAYLVTVRCNGSPYAQEVLDTDVYNDAKRLFNYFALH